MDKPRRLQIAFVAGALVPLAVVPAMLAPAASKGPYFASGIKICEADSQSVIIWTRLTRNAEREGADRPLPIVHYRDPKTGALTDNRRGRADMEPVVEFPKGSAIDTIEGAVPGAPGEVRVRYRAGGGAWRTTPWKAVDVSRDFTAHFPIRDLKPATAYDLQVENRSGHTVNGGFRTAPLPDQPARVVFTVVTGTAYPDKDLAEGYKIYAQMRKLDPSFFVHTGDIVYYDELA
ncbi:MAG: hypothetical protein HY822_11350, partial [Acidobacteria bacterium]|nr:hypothetical protein [Acidobacteriota bacterium]